MSRSSGGNSSGAIERLRPTPITAQPSCGLGLDQDAGQLAAVDPDVVGPLDRALDARAPAPRPPRRRRAARRAAAAGGARRAGAGSPSRAAPCRRGAVQVRPWRPRPAVCSAAVTTVPCGAPASASSRARVLVESVTRKWRWGVPKLIAALRRLLRRIARINVAPSGSSRASASRASTRPSMSWRSASTWTSRPAARAASLVIGPIETTRASAREAVAERLGQVADGRGGGEGDVVGALRGLDRLRRRAPRAPSRRGRRRRPRRRARAARRGGRRAPRRRGRRAPGVPSTSTPASASTSASATKRSGTTSAAMPCSARARAVPGPIAATVAPASARASSPAAASASNSSRTPLGLVRQTSA